MRQRLALTRTRRVRYLKQHITTGIERRMVSLDSVLRLCALQGEKGPVDSVPSLPITTRKTKSLPEFSSRPQNDKHDDKVPLYLAIEGAHGALHKVPIQSSRVKTWSKVKRKVLERPALLRLEVQEPRVSWHASLFTFILVNRHLACRPWLRSGLRKLHRPDVH